MSDSLTFGRYTTSKVLGRGAMGVVYAAVDPVIGRNVALKMIRDDYGSSESAEITSRFEREFQSAGRLSHPNIVPIYDVGREGDAWYIAMELVEGASLEDTIAEGPSPVQKSLNVIAGIAAALDHSHDLGVVHRDIKPANILITTSGVPKVTDFGVAKLSSNTMTAAGSILGTPAYMSPEQARGEILTGASDQFSLGVIAYQLLAGKRPFDGESPTTVMFKIVSDQPETPSTVNPKLPPALDAVLLRALNKDPEQRFSGCVQFADALRAAWGMDTDATVLTTSPPAAPPGKKSSGMPMIALGIAAAAVLAIIGWRLLGSSEPTENTGADPVDAVASSPAAVDQPDPETPATVPVESPEGAGTDSDSAVAAPARTDDTSGDGEVEAVANADQDAVAAEPATPEPPPVVGEPFTVTSQPPGAAITLDGVEVGTTPYELEVVPDRRYAMQLALDGYTSASWAFALDDLSTSQRQSATLHFPMQPDVEPGLVSVDADYAVSATARPLGGGQTRRFNAAVGLQMSLPPGSWAVTVSAPEVFLSQRSTVNVTSGGNRRLSVPIVASVRIAAIPGNCRVSIDGQFVDVTPLQARMVAGDHEFLFEWPATGASLTVNERIVRDGQSVFATAPQQ